MFQSRPTVVRSGSAGKSKDHPKEFNRFRTFNSPDFNAGDTASHTALANQIGPTLTHYLVGQILAITLRKLGRIGGQTVPRKTPQLCATRNNDTDAMLSDPSGKFRAMNVSSSASASGQLNFLTDPDYRFDIGELRYVVPASQAAISRQRPDFVPWGKVKHDKHDDMQSDFITFARFKHAAIYLVALMYTEPRRGEP